MFITTSTFSQGARDFASGLDSKIVLIDGEQLAQYMIDFGVGVSTRKTFQLKAVDTDYFNEE